MHRRGWVAGIAVLLLAAAAGAESGEPGHGNTFAKDFVMDAPWRVRDAQTPIPLTIVLKDCDTDDIRQLHWVRCWDVTGGGSTLLWGHDFGDERIGDDAPEANYWTYVTTVTEGHPSLPDGTPLTPANLGYAAGQALALEVSVYYRDDWFNYTETRRLRVQVGNGAFPWPANWFGGDSHFHTMYTNNIAEFGVPVPAVALTAAAVGLHWLSATDHSCDLDETGDGSYSYATRQWECTLQTPAGTETRVRDVFAHGSSWGGLGADLAEWGSPELRLIRGVELNVASVDADSYQKTLHALVYNPEYIPSPLSGALGERPVWPALPDGLDQLAADGFAYAAHPLVNLATEWGGVDWGVNGALWGDEDLAVALTREGFRGLEAFNTRETRHSTDTADPWGDFDAGQLPGNPYPNELLQGIALWDALLRGGLGETPRRIALSGGSDAHGDFNYATYFGLDDYATDNAIGKVQTVVFVPGGHAPGDLPPAEAILEAYRAGRSVATDGPFLEIGVDRDGDGDWHGPEDLMIGDHGVLDPQTGPPLSVRWATLPEFGTVTEVRIWVGATSGTGLFAAFDPSAGGQGLGGEATLPLVGQGLLGPVYLRAELLTSDGASGHRAYTNPIWVTFAVDAGVGPDGPLASGAPRLFARPNPFAGATLIRCDRPVELEICDPAGRRVRRLTAAGGSVSWDGTDDRGRPLPGGVYGARTRDGRTLRLVRLR
jgi:hypothetical protein